MTLIVDAGPLLALVNAADPAHGRVENVLDREPGSLVVPAPVTAEADYLLAARFGEVGRLAFLEDLADGRFAVECLEPAEYRTIVELERQYADLTPGLADLSMVVLAHRFGTRRLATFDERHFRAIRPLDGGAFALLPADS